MRPRDPDTAELWRDRLSQATAEFHAGTMSDDVYRALLKCAGFYGRRLSDEFAYQDAVRYNPKSR
jgi:hypothetical protein